MKTKPKTKTMKTEIAIVAITYATLFPFGLIFSGFGKLESILVTFMSLAGFFLAWLGLILFSAL